MKDGTFAVRGETIGSQTLSKTDVFERKSKRLTLVSKNRPLKTRQKFGKTLEGEQYLNFSPQCNTSKQRPNSVSKLFDMC